jgi:dynein heavy chain
LFSEGQIKEEVFLQDIDSLLNSGEVPNLYAVDEQQEILEVRFLRLCLKMRLSRIYSSNVNFILFLCRIPTSRVVKMFYVLLVY